MRSDIFDACITALQNINGSTSSYDSTYTYQTSLAQVSRGAKFFGEINDFPFACLWVDSESRFHIGADERYPIMYFTVRALFDGDPSNAGIPAVDIAENFLEDLDHVLKNYKRWCPAEVIEVRALNLATDSGMLEPRSVAECVFEVVYLNTP